VIAELDVWRAAALMLKRYGADAAVQAALRADELFEAGDEHGTATWRAIVRAIEELQRERPSEDERVQ
jgi:triphosphoribosyl-dephospho-CoA synthetase